MCKISRYLDCVEGIVQANHQNGCYCPHRNGNHRLVDACYTVQIKAALSEARRSAPQGFLLAAEIAWNRKKQILDNATKLITEHADVHVMVYNLRYMPLKDLAIWIRDHEHGPLPGRYLLAAYRQAPPAARGLEYCCFDVP